MIEPAVARPLVRPRFLKWSLVVFVLLVPLVGHAASDYLESRRFADHLAHIRENHEPVSVQEIEPRWPLTGEAAAAERLYRAAAALSEPSGDDEARSGLAARFGEALRSDKWPDDLIDEMRRRLADREEALRLLDRTTPLRLEGLPPSTSYRYAELFRLGQLARLRTALFAIDGDGNRAADSAYSLLRLIRARQGAFTFPVAGDQITTVAVVLNHTSPDNGALARLEAGLKELDRDQLLKDTLLLDRAIFLDNMARDLGRNGVDEWLLRPWMLQAANRRLDRLADLVEASNRPWPRKLDPVTRAGSTRDDGADAVFRIREASTLVANAASLARVRMTRIAVAGVRYRLAHHATPPSIRDLVPEYLDANSIDPFSGKSFRYTVEPDGFSVRSEGWHRRVTGTRPDTEDPAIRIRAR